LIGGKRIYLLAQGRLVNLAAAEGHPASVMISKFKVIYTLLCLRWDFLMNV